MLDTIIVTLIVLGALVYLAWKFTPAAGRRKGASRPACGGCETCGGCDARRPRQISRAASRPDPADSGS